MISAYLLVPRGFYLPQKTANEIFDKDKIKDENFRSSASDLLQSPPPPCIKSITISLPYSTLFFQSFFVRLILIVKSIHMTNKIMKLMAIATKQQENVNVNMDYVSMVLSV